MRILEAYFNIDNKKQFIMEMLWKNIVEYTSLIRQKDITDKIIKYTFNMLIILQIEF